MIVINHVGSACSRYIEGTYVAAKLSILRIFAHSSLKQGLPVQQLRLPGTVSPDVAFLYKPSAAK